MRALLLALSLLAVSPALAAQRCAEVSAGVVVNVIAADCATFNPGGGLQVIASPTAEIGDTYAGGVFTHVAPVTSPQTAGLNFLQFMALFTPTEQAAVIGSSDTQVKIFNLMAAGAPQIDLTDSRVIGGVNYLASVGLIQSSRVATILSGATP